MMKSTTKTTTVITTATIAVPRPVWATKLISNMFCSQLIRFLTITQRRGIFSCQLNDGRSAMLHDPPGVACYHIFRFTSLKTSTMTARQWYHLQPSQPHPPDSGKRNFSPARCHLSKVFHQQPMHPRLPRKGVPWQPGAFFNPAN